MKQNNQNRLNETLPVAAGAEMITFFSKGMKGSCVIGKGNCTSLCRITDAYMPPMGQNIRRLREQSGMTQRQIAYKLRVSMQAVSKWERGLAYPDVSLLVPISRLFSVTLDELFGCD